MACVPYLDPTCNPVADLIEDSATKVLTTISTAMSESAAWAVKTLVTGWLMTPSPIMDNEDVVNNLRRYTYWAVAAIAVFSLLVAATRMALERNGKAATDAASGLVKLILVTSLAVPVTITLTEVGDSYARWIINQSAGQQLGERVALFAPAAGLSGITVIVAIVVSFMCLLVSMVQMLISILVGALKIFLCGVAPIPAAANIAGGGKTTLARYLSWLVAALLYKPAAATIYAMAFWMLGTGTSFETVLTGVVVIAAAILTMPALLRLLAPITAQMTGSGGGGALAAAAAGAGTIATGAVRMAAAGGGGGGGAAPTAPGGTQGAPPQRAQAAIGPGGGGGGATGGGPGGGSGGGSGAAPGGGPSRAGTAGGASGAGSSGAAGGGVGAGGAGTAGGGAGAGAAAGGAGAGAGAGAAAGGGAAAAGPAGAGVAAGAAAAKAGPAVVRKVGGLASGAAGGGEQE